MNLSSNLPVRVYLRVNLDWLLQGDSVIRYLEIVDDEPYFFWLSMYNSNIPLRGVGYMPKRGVNVNACEIARYARRTVSD